MAKISKRGGSGEIGQSFKTLNCKRCGDSVKNVDGKAAGVVCSKCVSQSLNPSSDLKRIER
jgi:hypothetical protein